MLRYELPGSAAVPLPTAVRSADEDAHGGALAGKSYFVVDHGHVKVQLP